MTPEKLQARARAKLAGLRRRRRDARYTRALGRFVEEGLLTTNQEVVPHSEPLRVADVLWAGEVEPRFLELLAALLVKTPSMFVDPTELPEDLAGVVRRLRRNLEPPAFRGVPGRDVYRWLPKVVRRGLRALLNPPARPRAFP